MKNKKVVIVGLVLGLIVLFGGGYFVLSSRKEPPISTVVPEPQIPVEERVDTLLSEDIGLTLTVTPDNRKVIMQISQVEEISSLDYELSYTAKGDIPRGVIGHIDVKVASNAIKQEIILGTCSDVCHYDEDVSDIKLVVKVAKTDNKVYSVEQSLGL